MEKNTNLAKNLEGKAGGWEVHSGFEKLQHIHENQEDHTPIQDCIYTQESTEKALISHFWLTLIFSASKSYKLRQSSPLAVGTLKTWPMCTQNPLARAGRLNGSRHLRKMSGHQLTIRLTEQRLQRQHNIKNTGFTELV